MCNVMASFSREDDIAHDLQWQSGLDLYLKSFQCMYRAMQSGKFKTVSTALTDPQTRALKQRNKQQSEGLDGLKALLAKTETDKQSALAGKEYKAMK